MSDIKIGFGFYRHMLNDEAMRFARQCGATHAVVHLVDYNAAVGDEPDNQPVGDDAGWGVAGATAQDWTVERLTKIKEDLHHNGLTFYAIENFDPVFWYDILLDGPKRSEQITRVKEILQMLGEVGVPVMGYNFSLAGVAGRIVGNFARGGAESVGMDGVDERPVPNGMVWNMMYDPGAPAGVHPTVTHDDLWDRLRRFLEEVLPVAEACNVRLAAHPDDPPVPSLRGEPRLVYQPSMYQRLIDIRDSPSNGLEFCIGTIAEMTEGDVYEATRDYTAQGKVAYVHLRNVRGKAPHYHEVFIDEGAVDFVRIMQILKKNNYDGVIIPDHTPQMTCRDPWRAGMAHAIGYIKGLVDSAERLPSYG